MKAIFKDAAFVTRLEARDGLLCRLISRYYAPYCSDFPADVASKLIAGAVMLNYIPMPQRAGGGWMANPAIAGAKGSDRRSLFLKVCALISLAAALCLLLLLLACA